MQRLEEMMPEAFDELHRKRSFPDNQSAALTASFAPAVDGNQKVMASALYFQDDLTVVGQYDRAHVQTVWGNRRHGNGIALGRDDRPAYAQRVSGGAGRRSQNQTVGLVSVQIDIVDRGANGDHRRAVSFQHRNLVEPERVTA